MPVSGLVLTLSEDRTHRSATLAALRNSDSIEIGEVFEHRLPVVVDTAESEADQEVWRWLHTLPGVLFVDLVCTDSSTDQPSVTKERDGKGRI